MESCFTCLFYARSKVKLCNTYKPFLLSDYDFNIISLFVLQQSYKSAQGCMFFDFTFASQRIKSYPKLSARMLLRRCFIANFGIFCTIWDILEISSEKKEKRDFFWDVSLGQHLKATVNDSVKTFNRHIKFS